ncbi:MAG: biotin--[acetyl-CoA-carboxylase] ligase, partial [Acetobacteraceae bacterium]
MFDVRIFGTVGSTSDEALRLAREGAAHGTVVVAREQTAGRGRVGRHWVSPPGNLYLSVLLRLGLPPVRIAEASFVTALAVAEMVDVFL